MFSSGMIADAVEAAGLGAPSAEALERLAIYGNLLLKWNGRMNLTAVREPSAILERHILESVATAQALPAGVRSLLDFGSGAGLPGVPIAICRAEIAVTLAESQSKKAAFLSEVARDVPVGLRVHAGRVETLPKAARFNVVTLRAVDRMLHAVAEARGRVAVGSFLVMFATAGTRDELLQAAGVQDEASVEEKTVSPHSSVLICRT